MLETGGESVHHMDSKDVRGSELSNFNLHKGECDTSSWKIVWPRAVFTCSSE